MWCYAKNYNNSRIILKNQMVMRYWWTGQDEVFHFSFSRKWGTKNGRVHAKQSPRKLIQFLLCVNFTSYSRNSLLEANQHKQKSAYITTLSADPPRTCLCLTHTHTHSLVLFTKIGNIRFFFFRGKYCLSCLLFVTKTHPQFHHVFS